MGRKRKNNKIPRVHSELEGLDLTINEFGEIISNLDIDKVNAFLTKTVPDKKLINRYDDKYQQEFKELGLGGKPDEEDLIPIPDMDAEPNDEEDLGALLAKKSKKKAAGPTDPKAKSKSGTSEKDDAVDEDDDESMTLPILPKE